MNFSESEILFLRPIHDHGNGDSSIQYPQMKIQFKAARQVCISTSIRRTTRSIALILAASVYHRRHIMAN